MEMIMKDRLRPSRMNYAVSLALASMVAGSAMAQDSNTPQEQDSPAARTSTSAPSGAVQTVQVVGTRRSQQSSIERKKNAATAMDSIVAEDVGTLPDRNIGEAISRMAGIALDRGDFGEGVNVSVRGNGPELTRVELDGQAVSSAGGTDMNGGGDGRGTEFRQLSADLIKSVDVVKGSTADMTEGSLGGGIIIKTRTGLDFKKPFVSLRVAGTQSNLNKKWEPDTNLILSNKYLGGRLGVLLNASSITLDNESHQMQNSQSGNGGLIRPLDFDQSPEKTFTFQPSALDPNNDTIDVPIGSYKNKDGSYWNASTPVELLTRSAAAQTKQDCYRTFPDLTGTAELANIASSKDRTNAINARQNELLSCLNQWNDYAPPLLRYIVKRQIDKRQNLDLRTDFKVNHELTVYAKGSYSRRKVDDNYLTYSLGNPSYNTAGTYTDINGVRTPNPGSGYYYYDTPSWVSGKYGVNGTVSDIVPGSVVVDATHHLTGFTFNDGGASTDRIHNQMGTTTRYLQLGGEYRHDGLTAEFLAGDSNSSYYRGDKRASFGYDYGQATLTMQPDGLWTYAFPAGTDVNSIANYSKLYPATDPTQPVRTNTTVLNYTPREGETRERTAKLDLTYALPAAIPFFTRVKGGVNLRDTGSDSWTGGSRSGTMIATAQGDSPAVYLPSAQVRSSFVGCQNTATTTPANGCQYGYLPSTDGTARQGQMVLTPQQYQDIVTKAMTGQLATPTMFFNQAAGRPAELVNNWTSMDIDKLYSMAGVPNMNLDCIKECVASDGKVYQQPVSSVRERTQALYLMADFSLDHIPFTARSLPFGWQLEGNMGYRYVRTKVEGTGQMSFTSITTTPSYDPLNPGAAGGTITSTVTKNTTISSTSHDFMPIYNLALWVVPDKVVVRYNHAKTVARPPVSRLISSGTCTYDETKLEDTTGSEDMSCSTMGNPALRSFTNINQNLSVEYYPNKDTMFSASAYKQEGIVGGAITQHVSNAVFAGTSVVDPLTGKPLADQMFDYNTYINGPASTRRGVEFATKTAFTFLPWKLRYTGLDANYTRQRSDGASLAVDMLTGLPLPPLGEPKYSYNWALWYDDGKFSARVAVQVVAQKWSGFSPQGARTLGNIPAVLAPYVHLPYNPGQPEWTDATRYIDGKIGYKVNKNVELFVEGRNLGNATTSSSQGPSGAYANVPTLLGYNYPGRRITVGANFRFGG
jgi:TonB-dependent receptor